jgi:predicted MFS family arabinose efflux permease
MHTLPRLLVVCAASWFGTYATPVVLAFAVLDRHAGAGAVGVVLSADTVGMVATTVVGGAVADRLGRSLTMAAAEFAATALQLAGATLLVAGVAPLPWLVLTQFLVGVSRGVFNPAATGLVPDLIADEALRRRANGLIEAAQATARLAAPAIGGIVVATAGAGAALFVNGGTYLVSGVLLATLPRSRPAPRREPLFASIAGGWREFRRHEWLWLTIAWFALLQALAQGPLLVLGPVLATQQRLGAQGWGLVLAALGLGSVAGAGLTALLRLERPLRPAVVGYLLNAPLLALLAAGAAFPLVLAAAFAAGGGGGFFSATWFTVFQRNVPRESLARISAFDWAASLSGLPVGMLIAPRVGEAIGASATLAAAAAAVVVPTLLLAGRRSVAGVVAAAPSRRQR